MYSFSKHCLRPYCVPGGPACSSTELYRRPVRPVPSVAGASRHRGLTGAAPPWTSSAVSCVGWPWGFLEPTLACDPPACLGVTRNALTVPKGHFWSLRGSHRRRGWRAGAGDTDAHAAAGCQTQGRGSGSRRYSQAGGRSGRTKWGLASGDGCGQTPQVGQEESRGRGGGVLGPSDHTGLGSLREKAAVLGLSQDSPGREQQRRKP